MTRDQIDMMTRPFYRDGAPRGIEGYIDVADGVSVAFNPNAVPSIQWNHIDGPLLHMRSGELHWLTLWERIRIWWGADNAFTLERKYAPEFVKRWLARAQAEFAKQSAANGVHI